MPQRQGVALLLGIVALCVGVSAVSASGFPGADRPTTESLDNGEVTEFNVEIPDIERQMHDRGRRGNTGADDRRNRGRGDRTDTDYRRDRSRGESPDCEDRRDLGRGESPRCGSDEQPEVNITVRADPVHENPIEYPVRGTVTGAREIQNVTVLVDGERRKSVSLTLPSTPQPSFSTVVSLDDSMNEIQVVAEANSQKYRDSLKLDGDGLPDVFEKEIGTDPLDADSDLPDTPEDEGENGILDGREDFDGDGLTATFEYTLGTDPTSEESVS